MLPTRRIFLGNLLVGLPCWGLGLARLAQAKDTAHFKLGIITDEISQDLDQALSFLKSYSLSHCELRELWDKNIMNMSQDELTRAKGIICKHGVRVSNIASPIFKYDLPEMPAPEAQRDIFRAEFTDQDTDRLLRRACELAHFFDTQLIRVFSYWRVEEPDSSFPYVRDRLARAAEVAGENGVTLGLENEPVCNVGTGKELGWMLKEINSPHLRGVWDPGNAVTLGELAYPDGYQAVRGLFSHVHVKDAKPNATSGKWEWLPIGAGVVGYQRLFRALREDKYGGVISLETHYRRPDGNKTESTRESLEGLLGVLRDI